MTPQNITVLEILKFVVLVFLQGGLDANARCTFFEHYEFKPLKPSGHYMYHQD